MTSLLFVKQSRLNNCLWSDIKKEAFKKTLKLRPKTSQDLLEFYLNRNILTKITGMSYTQHFQSLNFNDYLPKKSPFEASLF